MRQPSMTMTGLDDRYLAVRHELLTEDYGRIRNVVTGPEGAIYFLTSNADDVIGRLDSH